MDPVLSGIVRNLGFHRVVMDWLRPYYTAIKRLALLRKFGAIHASIYNHGFVAIVDRKKDMIIHGGENISCLEVDDALPRGGTEKTDCRALHLECLK